MTTASPLPRRILVTGFMAFAQFPANTSEALVRALEAEGPGVPGVELRTCVLPVEYAAVEPAFARAADFFRPDEVLCFGMRAGQPEAIRIERVATNLDDCPVADNAGEVRTHRPIRPDGWAALRATAPVGLLRDSLRLAAVPTRTSNSAGTFLCNHLLYHALDRAEAHRLGARPAYRCGFFHVPAPPEADLPELVRAARVMIAAVVTGHPGGTKPRRRRRTDQPRT